jgi:hypothetical protein
MNDLLAIAIEAHGGLRRWNSFTKLEAALSIDGVIWHLKQQPRLLTDKTFEIKTHTEELTITPFSAPDMRSVFVPGRLTLEPLDVEVVESRENLTS